ncbi:MAG: hypothetical protein NC331_10130 [Lachnospiraceae bacterium]|nr:hypothetical protein [Lachnospiraceae bacterium]MCM1239729.1 hypothetical protein [Lachnospiraceae bacterium]MCM1303008.1 hypothetical protein [Butyrivibrio sp.]MCM1343783.1 hypothetical protein [Muribaculaceae bacterium]MCM1411314.1 hypothetical protein [Lachnospiraceae bacterium]
MIRENMIKKLFAAVFVMALFVGFVKSGSYLEIQKLADYLRQDMDPSDAEKVLNLLEAEFSSTVWNQQDLINLNGSMARLLNMQGFYSDMGMYVTDDLYIVSASDDTSTDYEFDEVAAFSAFLEENGINLLYVNEPTKYMDDALFSEEFGIETYSNRNADVFIARLRDAGIPVIDLRDDIRADGLDIFDLFYRTDHHWTTRAGLWAAQVIAGGLNEYCGYDIDTSIYDEMNYTFREWSECWLGEQGRKIAETYVGLDDYTEISPDFPTSYTFRSDDGDHEGTFDDFINESVYNLENNVYENESWHYSYRQIDCINHNIESGKVLIIGDSYEQVTEPFLSLGIRETDILSMRDYTDSFSLREHILQNGYDTVIICYAQFMIGAHDDPSSANYRMFSFDN